MYTQLFYLDPSPEETVINMIVAKLDSLTDNNGTKLFNTVLPTSRVSYKEILESATPAAFVSFGNEMKGYNATVQFDEFDIFPHMEILFLLKIPNNDDGSYPDILMLQKRLEYWVLLNLKVPSDDPIPDAALGIQLQLNSNPPHKLLWEFRAEPSNEYQTVEHRYNIRNEWIEQGRMNEGDAFYLSSIRMFTYIQNRPQF